MAELPQSTEYPEFGFDGKLTIYGILRKYFTIHDELGHNIGLSRKWNPNTTAQYARDYMDRLLPIMAQLFGREKPMHTYSADDFEAILNRLRNTYHYHLGFPWTSIQYWIAHEIEDAVIARNHFSDEDTLHELSNQYMQHPIFHIFDHARMMAISGERTSFCIAPDDTFFVQVTALEPNQPLYLDLNRDKAKFNVKMIEYSTTVSSADQVNIIRTLYQVYTNEMSHL